LLVVDDRVAALAERFASSSGSTMATGRLPARTKR
jgi:hypothetical protein